MERKSFFRSNEEDVDDNDDDDDFYDNSLATQDDHVFATSRGTGVLVVYKIDDSGKLSR